MYVKYGQTLAGLTNTFSLAWINEFRKLEDQVRSQCCCSLCVCVCLPLSLSLSLLSLSLWVRFTAFK
jgi:hypothetical protein|eukprot:COSAG03_NODE_106_length_12644_cov_262.577840_14_plen_67_part_00